MAWQLEEGGMALCEMWDSPMPLVGFLIVYATLIAVAAGAGWLCGSTRGGVRVCGTILVGIVFLFALFDYGLVRRVGISTDRATCMPLGYAAESALLIGINLVVAATVLLAWRASAGRALMSSRRAD